jgi:hypothetical protein
MKYEHGINLYEMDVTKYKKKEIRIYLELGRREKKTINLIKLSISKNLIEFHSLR